LKDPKKGGGRSSSGGNAGNDEVGSLYFVYLCIYLITCVQLCIYGSRKIFIYINICMYVCIYMYIYVNKNTGFIHTYIYLRIFLGRWWGWFWRNKRRDWLTERRRRWRHYQWCSYCRRYRREKCRYVYVYIYIYVYKYMYIRIYVYMYVYKYI
jgi:hypothetical protein